MQTIRNFFLAGDRESFETCITDTDNLEENPVYI